MACAVPTRLNSNDTRLLTVMGVLHFTNAPPNEMFSMPRPMCRAPGARIRAVTCCGFITAGAGLEVVDAEGRSLARLPRAFDHFVA
jgi:hypothetical protein